MLETLVSSRIRRTLLEHLLTHSREPFYLRGLAKDLGLSVSPLRRELKRLEHSGMLRAAHEGNMLFYAVNLDSPAFLELKQVVGRTEALSAIPAAVETPLPQQVIPVGVISAGPRAPFWRSPLGTPALIGAAGVGMALLLILASLAYLTLANQRLASQVSKAVTARISDVTIGVRKPSAAGAMQGSRWRLVPGGFGGFSAPSGEEAY